jgi:hypothetical protein
VFSDNQLNTVKSQSDLEEATYLLRPMTTGGRDHLSQSLNNDQDKAILLFI